LVPQPVRTGVSNFYDNATYPVTIVNGLLQGKFRQGGADTLRFLLNSTVGIFGLSDPATAVGLAEHQEDFGLTLAKWGAPQGPFVMLPVLGPFTARSAVGIAVNVQVNPILQMQNSSWRSKLAIAWFVETRAGLIGPDELVQDAFDPYAFLRDAYLQNRTFLLQDDSGKDALLNDSEFFEDADLGDGDDF
jgi:phospholipid-binding lipoprotein MlaA